MIVDCVNRHFTNKALLEKTQAKHYQVISTSQRFVEKKKATPSFQATMNEYHFRFSLSFVF